MRQRLRHDITGAGIVTVLVAMFVILAMGATLLYTSVTGLQIKSTDRNSEENFYKADAAMSFFSAGIEQAVTESIGAAYLAVLNDYADIVNRAGEYNTPAYRELDRDGCLSLAFDQQFCTAFFDWSMTVSGHAEKIKLFQTSGASGEYEVNEAWIEIIKEQIDSQPDLGEVTLTVNDSRIKRNDTAREIVIRGVTLTYQEGDYQTDISTDAVISYPPFKFKPSVTGDADPLDNAIVAQNGLICTTTCDLQGNTYAGGSGITIDTNTVALNYSNGRLVCGRGSDGVHVEHGAAFNISGGEVWAPRIVVSGQDGLTGSNTRFTTDNASEIHVADDLELSGKGANVQLAGDYSGFGDENTPTQSSSIIVTGLDARLDLSGLSSLELGGRSFVNKVGSDGNNGYAAMGQSIATTGDQLAYLVPSEYVTVKDDEGNSVYLTNPVIGRVLTTTELEAIRLQVQDDEFFVNNDIHITGIKSLTAQQGGGIQFLFLDFGSIRDANKYFTCYFTEHPDRIDSYIRNYLSFYQGPNETETAGTVYVGNFEKNDELYTYICTACGYEYQGTHAPDNCPNSGSMSHPSTYRFTEIRDSFQLRTKAATDYINTQSDAASFAMYSRTLTDKESSYENPYLHFVRTTDSLPAFFGEATPNSTTENGKTYEFKSGDDTVALIVDGNFNFSPIQYPSVSAIICTGNVDIVGPGMTFNGAVYAGGTITLNISAVKNQSIDAEVLLSTCNGRQFQEFLRNGSRTESGIPDTDTPSWDVEQLVQYRNWGKNNNERNG